MNTRDTEESGTPFTMTPIDFGPHTVHLLDAPEHRRIAAARLFWRVDNPSDARYAIALDWALGRSRRLDSLGAQWSVESHLGSIAVAVAAPSELIWDAVDECRRAIVEPPLERSLFDRARSIRRAGAARSERRPVDAARRHVRAMHFHPESNVIDHPDGSARAIENLTADDARQAIAALETRHAWNLIGVGLTHGESEDWLCSLPSVKQSEPSSVARPDRAKPRSTLHEPRCTQDLLAVAAVVHLEDAERFAVAHIVCHGLAGWSGAAWHRHFREELGAAYEMESEVICARHGSEAIAMTRIVTSVDPRRSAEIARIAESDIARIAHLPREQWEIHRKQFARSLDTQVRDAEKLLSWISPFIQAGMSAASFERFLGIVFQSFPGAIHSHLEAFARQASMIRMTSMEDSQ
ncbi:insulinase family protein [Glycomyces sp. L485]|uniref:insulinase family protein n=1 Tax=Glycomyces sp. L485 TaxID=2909235 RepID=UPI001F4B8F3B|nr:insulinase family protein [Glycomyces sp. L485]MCH7232160.1 insulinase family protein [Glycomyces sp. L485]